jgi:hypothetical protein
MSITNEMKKMIASNEFSKMLGRGVRVLKYSDLESYDDLNQIITQPKGYIILLIETEQNTGHYTALLKYNPNQFEFFDSYGLAPDQEFHFISMKIQSLLDESNHILTKLLKTLTQNGGTYSYNKMHLQQMKPDINTCGRFVCYRIFCFMKYNYSLNDFQKFLIANKKQSGMSYDEIITFVTKKLD